MGYITTYLYLLNNKFGACFYQNRCGGLPPIPGRMPEGGGPILSGLPGPRCP